MEGEAEAVNHRGDDAKTWLPASRSLMPAGSGKSRDDERASRNHKQLDAIGQRKRH